MADHGLESSFVMSGLVTPFLEGSISAPTVKEIGGPLTKMVIRTTQDWEITVNWEVHGSLLSKPTTASFPFTGDWIIRAYLESIGPGQDYTLPTVNGQRLSVNASKTEELSSASTDDRREYTATVSIPKRIKADGSTDTNGVPAGIYKLVVAVTHESSPGVPGPIAGFYESGMLQIYDPD
jgi:hypothetical protein